MIKKVYKKVERKPSHAGEILKTGFIEQYELQVETVADLLGITRGHLSRIINGHSPITPDIAIKLEVLTHTPASQWLALQSDYDTYMLLQKPNYKKYKKALNNWVSKALLMSAKERRRNEKIIKLSANVAIFAKQVNNNKTA